MPNKFKMEKSNHLVEPFAARLQKNVMVSTLPPYTSGSIELYILSLMIFQEHFFIIIFRGVWIGYFV